MVDIYHPRRDMFKQCYYWNTDEKISNTSEYALNHKVDGMFFAKPYGDSRNSSRSIGGVILNNDVNTISIITNDKPKLKSGSLVQYNGKMWITTDVQKAPEVKNSQYGDGIASLVISLRR